MEQIIDFFKNLSWDDIKQLLTQWYVICFFVLLIILIAFLIYICTFTSKKKRNCWTKRNVSIVRFFSIHYEDNYVYAVDKFNLSKKRKESLDWFYNSFTPQDKLRVIVWLNQLQKEDHNVPHHLELHVKVKSTKQPIFCVISVSSINYKDNIIHLESRLFPNIKKTTRKNKKNANYLKHSNEMQDLLQMHSTSPKSFFLIRLYSTNDNAVSSSKINHLITTLIISRIIKTCSINRYVCSLNSNEIIVVDFKISNKNEAFALSHTLASEITKVLFLSSISEDYGYKIGIVQEKDNSINFNEAVKLAREMSIYAESEEVATDSLIYDPNTKYEKANQTSIINDIRENMDRRTFSCKYTPIINLDGKVFGYQCELFAPKSLISSVADMQDYAIHNNFITELNRILYLETNQVFNFKPSRKIVYTTMDLKASQYLSYIDMFTHTELPRNVKTIFIISDEELADNQKTALEIVTELKNSGMLLGLKINSTTLELMPEIMKFFDYFFIYEDSFSNVFDSQNQILFGDMLARLNSYNGKVIALNVNNWNLVDLTCRMHIELISSSLLGQEEKQLPQSDAKKVSKFIQIGRRY